MLPLMRYTRALFFNCSIHPRIYIEAPLFYLLPDRGDSHTADSLATAAVNSAQSLQTMRSMHLPPLRGVLMFWYQVTSSKRFCCGCFFGEGVWPITRVVKYYTIFSSHFPGTQYYVEF